MSDLCVFTAGTDLDLLRDSCTRVGISLQEFDGTWSSFTQIKLVRAAEFLRTRSEPYAMWIDGHDSLILRPEQEILKRFHSFFGAVVVSAEANCWPHPEWAEKFPPAPPGCPRFLNAGGWIGYTPVLIDMLDWRVKYAKSDNDQEVWQREFLTGALLDRTLDYRRRIFASIADGPEALGSDSCVKHWNGKIPGRGEYWHALEVDHV